MRSPARIVCSLAASALLASCAAGPHQLRRTIDDWDHQTYVNSPWFNAAMWAVPVYPALLAGAAVLDFTITDPYFFWLGDAWDGKGTGFQHVDVEWTDGHLDSLLSDRGRWMRKER